MKSIEVMTIWKLSKKCSFIYKTKKNWDTKRRIIENPNQFEKMFDQMWDHMKRALCVTSLWKMKNEEYRGDENILKFQEIEF